MNTYEDMKEAAKEAIEICLKEGYSGYYCDLHNEVFNTDYYIIGRQEAKDALEEYGVFDAIDLVQKYEDDNFGERYIDLSDPEKLMNMVYYVIGDEVMAEVCEKSKTIDDKWNEEADEDTNNIILAEIA